MHDAVTRQREEVLQYLLQNRPLTLGHRGASADAPMNTLPAFKRALEQGADGVELDVQLSKDGVPVVIHDDTVDATTNGQGLVAEMTAAQLQALDAGSWFGASFAGTTIPTLAEVFRVIGGRSIINVEIKHTGRDIEPITAAVAAVIEQYAMQAKVIVSSFNPYVLKNFREIMPVVVLGWLNVPGLMPEIEAVLESADYDCYHPHYQAVGVVDVPASAVSKPIMTWTVNDAESALSLQQKGVRGLITDTPKTIVEALRS